MVVDHDDLLQLMLTARDPVTNLTMSDENICSNLVTFLIAGHETTSGLLSFVVSEVSVILAGILLLSRDVRYAIF